MAEEFGGPSLRDSEPAKWAVQFTGYLTLTEVRARSGKPAAFPAFDVRWADERHEGTCLGFLRDWLRNASYKEDFKRLSRQAEETYNLSSWAAGLSEPTDAESSLKVELIHERGMIAKIDGLKSVQDLKESIEEQGSLIDRMESHFWSEEGEVAVWRALSTAGKIFKQLDLAMHELKEAGTAEHLVQRYREDWWRMDRFYRGYRRDHDGVDRIARVSEQVRSVYREYLLALNEKFVDLLTRGKGRPVLEGIPPQADFWNRAVSKKKKKRAVFFVDALRYELAKELEENLKREFPEAVISLGALQGAFPSLTDIGMAALLPSEPLSLSVSSGQWDVRSGKKSGNL
ncbi:MAG: PglZ domain-containing protein, partial [Candidatus Tectomicrobia bacterium]|nr:PglZ domain-containing protein [Candidatus Tectomicrobia bacterium]